MADKTPQEIYEEHNGESARSWPAQDQCQCATCKAYLAAKK